MESENKLFEDVYQSVTQPFETKTAPAETADQGGEAGAEQKSVESQPSSPGEKPAGEVAQESKPELYDLDSFNKYFSTEFKDESSLKEILSSPSKTSQYEEQLKSKDDELKKALDKAQKYDDMIDNLDPKALYPDEEMYTYFKLKEKFPDKDQNLLAQIKGSSFDNLSDLDKLVLADKLTVKSNVSDSVRQKEILRRLDIDVDDLSSLDDSDRYKLAAAVAEKNQLFDEIRSFKPEPVSFDLNAQKEARKKELEEKMASIKTKWEPLAKSLLKNYNSAKAFGKNEKGDPIEIFNYAVDDNFKESFLDTYLKVILDSGVEPDESSLQIAANYLDERFKILNFDRIISEAIKHGKTITEDKAHDEIHSDKPQNTGEAPKKESDGKEHTLAEWLKIKGGFGT